jgi:hypothetical protein
MAYGPSLAAHFQRAAAYVDRILREQSLPICQPVAFFNHQTPREDSIFQVVLSAHGCGSAKTGWPPIRFLACTIAHPGILAIMTPPFSWVSAAYPANSVHTASSFDFKLLLNISATIVMPGDHCDMPPNSGWLNWAMLPPPNRSARKTRSPYKKGHTGVTP